MNRSALLAIAVAALVAACGTDAPSENSKSNGEPNNVVDGDCTPGERTCQDSRTLATCARSTDGTPRLVTTACLDSEECMNGDCVEIPLNCNDLCTPPETRCTPTGEAETCADHDGNGCNEFGAPVPCEAGQFCDPSDGRCKMTQCNDSCVEGETSCEEELITTCALGTDGCLAFGQGKECPEGESCMAGACMGGAGCSDECTEGELACSPDGKLRECRTDVDADTCAEFTDGMDCPGGQTCRMGACVAENACQDKCLAGEMVCLGNDIAACETQANGCLEFPAAPTPCPANESCQNMGGNVMCAPVAVVGDVVINEVFYDAVGDDNRANGSPTFIELFGPPGLSVANFTVELVNGSGGATYGSFTLPADAQLDGNGFAVIATDNPDSFLAFALPFFTNVYFVMTGASGTNDVMQNGPDNVQLRDDSNTVVDAVGYGDFASADFVGEGAGGGPDVQSGHSVGRDANGTDTDNNQADFLSYIPTPGYKNSDLILSEVYFDQPGTDDGSETFIELVNPAILGWEDLPLNGYVVRAVNGFNGDDYITTGALPGIELSGYNLNDGDEEGYVVICNVDTVGDALLDKCTALYEGVDFQNGPDNFVLEYNGRVIDAVGYGTFSGTDVFMGEGSAAPFSSSNGGKSLARWAWSDISHELDTNDNATDFHVVDPTPGAENPIP